MSTPYIVYAVFFIKFYSTPPLSLHAEPCTLYHKDLVVCFMQQGVSLLRSDIWRDFLLVLWFDIIQTNKGTQHIQRANRMTYQYKYISTDISRYNLQSSTTFLLIIFSKSNFFIWNTKNSDRYGGNMQNKHQHSLRER